MASGRREESGGSAGQETDEQEDPQARVVEELGGQQASPDSAEPHREKHALETSAGDALIMDQAQEAELREEQKIHIGRRNGHDGSGSGKDGRRGKGVAVRHRGESFARARGVAPMPRIRR
ncbi:hypothetical protein MAMT_00948 [Methylacidimicrobium tartarophylax]|uniref:Uncharacterized protein n=1 Tax=Methylacidimicrobium tartarophylax TaxID=1041768 RepID=A0A5E6ME15_9BACT|nr:hypothetical protein MAMT_00948 [Methylacidimicrobium tartarophylax]